MSLSGRFQHEHEVRSMVRQLSQNPLLVLYVLQACTYGAAAMTSWRMNHRPLTVCYSISALLSGLFGACYFLHLG